MGNGVSSRSAESPIPMERDVAATRGNPFSEDEVPTSVSRGAKQTTDTIPALDRRIDGRMTDGQNPTHINIAREHADAR